MLPSLRLSDRSIGQRRLQQLSLHAAGFDVTRLPFGNRIEFELK